MSLCDAFIHLSLPAIVGLRKKWYALRSHLKKVVSSHQQCPLFISTIRTYKEFVRGCSYLSIYVNSLTKHLTMKPHLAHIHLMYKSRSNGILYCKIKLELTTTPVPYGYLTEYFKLQTVT